MLKRISKEKAIEIILEEIEKGITFSECFSVKFSKFQLSEKSFSTYWNEAHKIYDKRQQTIQKKKDEALLTHELERQEHELETKDGQCIELIKHAIALNTEIESGLAVSLKWHKGKLCREEVTLTHKESNDKRELLAKLLADIRKIRGLDAPIKQENKHSYDLAFLQWCEEGLVSIKDDVQQIPQFEHLK